MQNNLMKFDPATNEPKPYPSHEDQYRNWHGKVAWLYNPWTGSMRDPKDIGSDVFGLLIRLDGEKLSPAPEYQEPTKSMICQRCGADRFKEPCKQQDMNCPIVATAHTTKDE